MVDVSSARSLKDDLLRPEAYASLANVTRVELVETHISWVFLLDREVFKVKKPVSLGFLDFRTEQERHAACEAEVVLNRRLAPDVYIEVVPIRLGADGRACVGGSGALVDWAVRMIRLPDAQRADVLLDAGALTPDHVDALAKKIASFHASCRNDGLVATYGLPSVIETNIEENFAQTRDVVEKYLSSDEAEEVRRWQRTFVRGHASLFSARADAGRVRDGHGDLRLEHVYVDGDKITVLDCIEFNERFRFADVCADVAFLSMDLAGHGRVDLAERLLAAYARETNDFDLYALVDFYESYRAYVRGKVSAMIATDPEIDGAARRRAAADARRYFLLALSVDRRPLILPAVVAVGGIIASGKSTVAERIGAEMGAPVIDADRTRKAMWGVEPTAPINDEAWRGAYDPQFSERVYAEVFRRAAVVLESGRPVVIDASFHASAMRRAARELASTHCVPFRFVECRAPAEACRARLVQREQLPGVSDGRLAIFDAFCDRFERVNELPSTDHIALDTTLAIETNLSTLRRMLGTWPRALVT